MPSAQVNCSGTVTALQYAYRWDGISGTEELVFTLLIFRQSGTDITVLGKTEVRTNSGECRDISACCIGTTSLRPMDQFAIPDSNFAFGIVIPAHSPQLLVGFLNSANRVKQYQKVSFNPIVGSTTKLLKAELVLDQGLRVLVFRICKFGMK